MTLLPVPVQSLISSASAAFLFRHFPHRTCKTRKGTADGTGGERLLHDLHIPAFSCMLLHSSSCCPGPPEPLWLT